MARRRQARGTFDRPRIDPLMQVNRRRRKWDGQEDLFAHLQLKHEGLSVRSWRILSSRTVPPPSNSIVDPRDGEINTYPRVRPVFSMSSLQCKTRPSAAILASFYNDGNTSRTKRSRDECTHARSSLAEGCLTRASFLFFSLSTAVHPVLFRRN